MNNFKPGFLFFCQKSEENKPQKRKDKNSVSAAPPSQSSPKLAPTTLSIDANHSKDIPDKKHEIALPSTPLFKKHFSYSLSDISAKRVYK
jgi:hypothetical protein